MKKKNIKIIILTFLTVICCILGVACKENEINVEVVAEAFREDVYVNEEYDVLNALENADKEYDYELTECYYLDAAFNKHEINFYGTKFVQTAPYDVYVTLKASKGKTVKEFEFVLNTEIRTNETERAFLEALSGAGVSKSITMDENYLYTGYDKAVKVSYIGTYNVVNDGVGIGGPGMNGSFTSWENVVFTAMVYNPQAYDITVGLMFVKENKLYNGLGYCYDPKTLSAGEWTRVSWSFRSYGVDYDLEEAEISYRMKVRISDASNLSSPYNYKLYFCGVELTDYSAEKFPDLETRTAEEIKIDEWNALQGDTADKYVWTHTVKDSALINDKYAKTTLECNIRDYEGSGIAKPNGVSDTSSYLEYKVTPTGAINTYYSCPISYVSSGAGSPMTDVEAALYTVEYWENAYLGFWVYNDTDSALTFRTTKTNRNYWDGNTFNANKKTWTYIKISLANDYGFNTNIFEEDSYNLKLFAAYSGTGYNTEDTYQDFIGKFYIDGFSIFSEEPEVRPEGNVLSDYAVQYDYKPTNYQYFYTTLTAEQSDVLYEQDGTTVKYTVSTNGTSAARRWFTPMAFGS